jgi:protein subunit release factor A
MAGLSERERAILDGECDVDVFTGPGPGGQHRNRSRNAVRLHHRPTGLIVTATRSRSLSQNLEAAFERLAVRLARLREKPKPRRPTRPTSGSQKRRIEAKQRRAATKRLRGNPELE